MSIEAKIHEGLDHHKAGRLEDAARCYREVLSADPVHPDALNLLGVIFQSARNWEMAVQLGKLASEHHPGFYAVWVNYGNALQGAGHLQEAVDAFNKALELQPHDPAAANNAASALNALGRHQEAFLFCETAAANVGDQPDILINRGNALSGLGRHDEARKAYARVLELVPDSPLGLFNMGRLLVDMGDFAGALAYLQTAVEMDPGNAQAFYSLGLAFQNLNAFDKAEAAYGQALAINPAYVDATNNRAAALQALERTPEAIPLFHEALQHEPDSADLHWNLSLALLKTGGYEKGFEEYEWRWQTPTFQSFARDWAQPLWQGEDLKGKTILVHAEQGFGDQLMFARFVPKLVDRGAKVTFECRPELKTLFQASFPDTTVIGLGDDLPDTDFQVPLMSLPNRLGTTLETLPTSLPYLSLPKDVTTPENIAKASGLKVGLCWSGSSTRLDNDQRSVAIDRLAKLASFDGLTLVNLQVGPGVGQFDDLPRDGAATLIDPTKDIETFADTAALIEQLDLVISVDTGVLHLAGALGKEAWGLMSMPTGFFWMEGRADSPWYPGLKLFRQSTPGQWQQPIDALMAALEQLL